MIPRSGYITTGPESELAPSYSRTKSRSLAKVGPYIPTAPLRRLLAPLIDEIGVKAVADLARLPERSMHWLLKTQRHVDFVTAESIILDVLGDPGLWHTVPELAAVYEAPVAA